MDQNGADSSTLKVVEIPQSATPAALEQGRVDGITVTNPAFTIATAGGKARFVANIFSAISPRFLNVLWFSTTGWVERNHAVAERFEQKGFGFEILIDRGNAVAQAYGVAYNFPGYLLELYRDVLKHDLAAHNDDPAWKLPVPARFVIDRSGIVREAKVDPDYRRRPEPADSLAVVRALAVPAAR